MEPAETWGWYAISLRQLLDAMVFRLKALSNLAISAKFYDFVFTLNTKIHTREIRVTNYTAPIHNPHAHRYTDILVQQFQLYIKTDHFRDAKWLLTEVVTLATENAGAPLIWTKRRSSHGSVCAGWG